MMPKENRSSIFSEFEPKQPDLGRERCSSIFEPMAEKEVMDRPDNFNFGGMHFPDINNLKGEKYPSRLSGFLYASSPRKAFDNDMLFISPSPMKDSNIKAPLFTPGKNEALYNTNSLFNNMGFNNMSPIKNSSYPPQNSGFSFSSYSQGLDKEGIGKKLDFTKEKVDGIFMSGKKENNFPIMGYPPTYIPTMNSPVKMMKSPKVIVKNDIPCEKVEKCTCTKTHCRKGYCQCFTNKKLCDGCQCKGCENTSEFYGLGKLEDSMVSESSRRLREGQICNCSKSNCRKNYCDCFKKQRLCSSFCKCIGCENNKEFIRSNNPNAGVVNSPDTFMSSNNNTANIEAGNDKGIKTFSKDGTKKTHFITSSVDKNGNVHTSKDIGKNEAIKQSSISSPNKVFTAESVEEKPCIIEVPHARKHSYRLSLFTEAFGIFIDKGTMKHETRSVFGNKKEGTNSNNNNNTNSTNTNGNNIIRISNIDTPKFINKKRNMIKTDSEMTKTCPTTEKTGQGSNKAKGKNAKKLLFTK